MLINIFSPNSEEIFYSWLSRYHFVSGNSWKKNSVDLFGKQKISPNILYPIRLDYLCSQLPKEFNIDAFEIINKHTIFPLYKPFMSVDRANDVVQGMKNGVSSHLLSKIGLTTNNKYPEKGLVKVCPECYHTDEIPYLRRSHQIPGNTVCYNHKKVLQIFDLSNTIDKTCIFDISELNITPEADSVGNVDLENYCKLAESIEFILNGSLSQYNILDIRTKYIERLYEKGYGVLGSYSFRQSKLLCDFLRFYPEDFLTSVNANFDINYKASWIRIIALKNNRFINPINHILFINFLFGNVKAFVEYCDKAYSIYKPFGDAPWLCLNPVCTNFKKPVILNCDVKIIHSSYGKKPVGFFKCSCGFEYSRTGPDENRRELLKIGKVRNYGKLWEEKLYSLIEEKMPYTQIAKILKCSANTVTRHATRLGINGQVNFDKFGTIYLGERKLDLSKLEKYKNTVFEFLRRNPHAQRIDIAKSYPAEIDYLYKNARNWIEEVLPKPFINKHKSFPNYKKIDWTVKDLEVNNQVKEVIEDILNRNMLIRITPAYIAKRLGYYGIVKSRFLDKMPYTKKTLDDYSETVDEYRKRRIRKVVRELISNGERLTVMNLRDKLGLKAPDYYALREYINSLIYEYSK